MSLSQENIGKLEKLALLKQDGALTEDEFACEKAKILAASSGDPAMGLKVAPVEAVPASVPDALNTLNPNTSNPTNNSDDTVNQNQVVVNVIAPAGERNVAHCCHFCMCFWCAGLTIPCWIAACCDCCCHQPCGCSC